MGKLCHLISLYEKTAGLQFANREDTYQPIQSDQYLFSIPLLGAYIVWFWFGLLLYVPRISYGHVETVSSSKHTFFLGKLDQAVYQYFLHILSRVTYNNHT